MIECEICSKYFHSDEIENCPECSLELCPSCYEEHVGSCLNDGNDEDIESSDSNIPTECPKCGESLELDIDYSKDGNGYKKTLYCSNSKCDYFIDVTKEMPDKDEDEDDEC